MADPWGRTAGWRPRGETGETLIEVIIAVMIIAIVGAALAGAILSSVAGSEATRQSADADVVLRSYASGVIVESQAGAAWDGTSGCLASAPAVPDGISTLAAGFGLSVSDPNVESCSSPGFQGVLLTVAGSSGFSKSLEIWVRQQ